MEVALQHWGTAGDGGVGTTTLGHYNIVPQRDCRRRRSGCRRRGIFIKGAGDGGGYGVLVDE